MSSQSLSHLLARILGKGTGTIQEHARWYVRTRWYFLLAIGIPGIVSNLAGEGFTTQVQRDTVLLSLALASNLVVFIISHLRKDEPFFKKLIVALITLDLITITFLIFTKGGVESRAIILYTIPMLMASAIFGSRAVYRVAWASIGLYGSLILLTWAGMLPSINAVSPELSQDTTYVFNTLAFFTSVLLIIGSLADFIIQMVRSKEEQAIETLEALEEAQKIARLGSWSWDIVQDSITWSRQMHSIMGTDPKHFKSTLDAYIKRVHPQDRQRVKKLVSESLETLQPYSFEHRIDIEGNTHWVLANGQVADDGNGRPVRAYGTLQDITAQKSAEMMAERRNRQMEKLNAVMVERELRMIELKQELEQARK